MVFNFLFFVWSWTKKVIKFKIQYKIRLRLLFIFQVLWVESDHDENADEEENKWLNYFTASQFYCIETICKPCGVVVAWTKFSWSESPTNILNFLNKTYPNKESHSSYVCIDKACLVLCTLLANVNFNDWLDTTRLIVDVYHYKNHCTSDYLCRKWCNPAPLNGSAPNLVVLAHDNQQNPYYKRAFNTQVCHIWYINTLIN